MADRRQTGVFTPAVVMMIAMCLVLVSCGGSDLPAAGTQGENSSPQSTLGPESADAAVPDATTNDNSGNNANTASSTHDKNAIVIDAVGDGVPLDRRLLGVNLPAWVGPSVLADEDFRQRTRDSGATLLRIPGGSWSNSYDWLGCEQGDSQSCFWTWAARPTDFVNFLRATGLGGMWTVSINDTAQQSAAAVAFFNGDVNDPTVIGVDRLGIDWGEVRDWAQLRAANGNPDPIDIMLWEVGNEVYGGKPTAGGDLCAEYGWEDVWTCDGTEYVEGIDGHDGALAIRAAMVAVDPDIEVGFVGVVNPNGWRGWGGNVIEAAGESLDFYIIHNYGFDESPDPEQALGQPSVKWPETIGRTHAGLPDGVPVAITEFNLVAVESRDTDQSMTRAMNAFFLAESIGVFAANDVAIANWWNLANGVAQNGTDYGLISLVEGEDYRTAPTYDAFALWGRTGTTLLDTGTRSDGLRVYPTRHEDGRLTILVFNLRTATAGTSLVIEGLDGAAEFDATLETIFTDDLNAQELIVEPVVELATPAGPIDLEFAPWSMNLIEVAAAP